MPETVNGGEYFMIFGDERKGNKDKRYSTLELDRGMRSLS